MERNLLTPKEGFKPFQMYSSSPEDHKGAPYSILWFKDGEPSLVQNVRKMEDYFGIDKHRFSFARFDPTGFVEWKDV